MADNEVERSAGAPELTPTTGGGDPSVHQLRLFLVLAEELHFGHAARRMFITQPAFSRQITALERRVGIGLVQRSTRRVELTPAGRALLPEARAAVDAVDRLRVVVQLQTRRVAGRLTVGFIDAVAAMPHARQILAEFRSRHPESTVEMRSLDFAGQVDALTSGEVDAAFVRPPLPTGIRTLRLAVESRVACLPAGDPLVSRQPLNLADLTDRVFVDVAGAAGGAVRRWWDYWTVNPRPDGTHVRFGHVVTDIESLLLAVAQGEGIAFLPAAARDLYPRPGLAYADVPDLPPATTALAWLPSRGDSSGVAALCEAARAVLRGAAVPRGRAPSA
ncbi:LysR family transcriptional regulator [Streptomyces sp. SID3343]|uniref:LysR family transcriptional regulator n=1 Tax=Streptomyces sp. SID3343 TaxID=2690260 RepID=UPI00136EED8A|nr:LysR family transcriptional regulator [Streptomyces sp. SID3343]MYW05455.1 LysR family transcriptional regulator [Streptomyces sp. SID3343]